MTTLYLPPNPATGQVYVATNGATYTWLGNRWSSAAAVSNGTAVYVEEGGDSTTWATPQNTAADTTVDGGGSLEIPTSTLNGGTSTI